MYSIKPENIKGKNNPAENMTGKGMEEVGNTPESHVTCHDQMFKQVELNHVKSVIIEEYVSDNVWCRLRKGLFKAA